MGLSKFAHHFFQSFRHAETNSPLHMPVDHCVWVAHVSRPTACATPRAARVLSDARINHVEACNCGRGARFKPPPTSSYRENNPLSEFFHVTQCQFSLDSGQRVPLPVRLTPLFFCDLLVFRLNRSRYPWRQLAGHPDSFVKAKSAKWILKLSSATERAALNAATKDPALRGVVVRFDGTTEVDAEEYLVLRNMLFGNRSPNILDVKLGQRTYNALDSDAAGHDTPRLDLLHKMIKIDPAEPTKMEQEVGVTKRRYMQYRESRTTSAVYGFRVDAMHVDGGDKDLFSKYIHSDLIESAKACLRLGCRNDMGIRDKIVAELENIDACLRKSHFFMHHEVVGSSILHVVSDDGEVNCKLLDFGKTVPSRTTLTHELDVSCLTTRSQEDGYLIGLRALITTWESL
eukprot:m.60306 g.60306  ORF g.60306 m.60306 type:complete len:402 (+) comp17430_c0_seq2:419-1624(+)